MTNNWTPFVAGCGIRGTTNVFTYRKHYIMQATVSYGAIKAVLSLNYREQGEAPVSLKQLRLEMLPMAVTWLVDILMCPSKLPSSLCAK